MAVLRGANTILNSGDGLLVLAESNGQSINSTSGVVLFEDISINKGSVYNSSTGVFSVPKSSFYTVDCSVFFDGGGAVSVYIIADKNGVSEIGRSASITKPGICSFSGSAYLQIGDEISIVMSSGDSTNNVIIGGGTQLKISEIFNP